MEKAKDAIYVKDHMNELTNDEISTYFTQVNDKYHLKPYLKNNIKFSQLDLVNDEYGNNIDLILCRNVLFYIDNYAKLKILSKFYGALKPGGLLIIGNSERLVGSWEGKFVCLSREYKIYQKL